MNNLVDLGKVAVTLGGTWNSATSYERLTYVLHEDDGCGYVSLRTNIGVTPGSDATVWQKSTLAGRSIYQLCVQHGTFVGTEAEFVAQYNDAVSAAESAASSASSAATRAQTVINAMNALIRSVTSSEQQRETAEQQRIANENARQGAETARENAFAVSKAAADAAARNAESVASGIQAEELRRQQAEAGRVSAESARVAAETARVQEMQSLENTINAMNVGLVGIKYEDGEVLLVQNSEAGTVTGASISDDGEITITFNV